MKKRTIKNLADYQKQQRIDKLIVILFRVFIIVFFFGLWELGSSVGFINEFLVSKPSAIVSLFITYIKSGELFKHVGISLYETFLGLTIGTIAGLMIAILLYLFPKVYEILDPYLVVLNALPKTALAPVLIIWIGTGVKGIVAVSITLSIVVTIISAYSYFVSVDKEKVRMLKTMSANKLQILTKLVLPQNYANIVSIVKINIGLAWVGVIVGEFLVSRGGIGYLVMYGGQVFKLDLVMMGVLILGIIAFLMYELLSLIEKYLKHEKKRKIRKHK